MLIGVLATVDIMVVFLPGIYTCNIHPLNAVYFVSAIAT